MRGEVQRLIQSTLEVAAQSHHSCSGVGDQVARTDDLLGWPGLAAEDRRNLRSLLAVLVYCFTEPDTTSQGTGGHTGNVNMSLARQLWISSAVALLPDHPMYPRWRDYMAQFSEYKLAENMAPGGGWSEFGGYHMWGYARLMWGLMGLDRLGPANLDRLFRYHEADMDYYLNLLTAEDSRFGARMIPAFGNSPPRYSEQLIEAAGSLARHNPVLAANLMWAWQANGALDRYVAAAAKPWIRPTEPALGSRCFPGFGVIFRAHQGPEETYLALRSGYLWGHWYADQGHVVLYSKGGGAAPLATLRLL